MVSEVDEMKELKELRYAKGRKLKGEIRGIPRQMYKENLLSQMAYYKNMYNNKGYFKRMWKAGKLDDNFEAEFRDAYMKTIKLMLDMGLADEDEAEFYRGEFYTKTEYTG